MLNKLGFTPFCPLNQSRSSRLNPTGAVSGLFHPLIAPPLPKPVSPFQVPLTPEHQSGPAYGCNNVTPTERRKTKSKVVFGKDIEPL